MKTKFQKEDKQTKKQITHVHLVGKNFAFQCHKTEITEILMRFHFTYTVPLESI